MTWISSRDTLIEEALARFPEGVNASFTDGSETYQLSKASLEDMARMQLGHLPVSALALPSQWSEILKPLHSENWVRDVSHHLCDYFPNFFVTAVYELQSLFAMKQMKGYIIGGITRDMLLSPERKYDIQDVDITMEGRALDMAKIVDSQSRNFELLQLYEAFGTAKIEYRGQVQFDFASTRREVYDHCGGLPIIESIGVPLEEDIIRRDFTVNALALSIVSPGKVVDCNNGLSDIEKRMIRPLKASSFFEDPTRILRALSFAARLDFKWDEDTRYLLEQFLVWMPQVYKGGGERVREELYKLLTLPESALKRQWLGMFLSNGLHRLIDTELPAQMKLAMPLAVFSERVTILQEKFAEFWTEENTWKVYLGFMLLEFPQPVVRRALTRLGTVRENIQVVLDSLALLQENRVHSIGPDKPVQEIFQIFKPMTFATACLGAILSSRFIEVADALYLYKSQLEPVKLAVTGDDIIKLGIPQGAAVGQWLKTLHLQKLQSGWVDKADEMSWLRAQVVEAMETNLATESAMTEAQPEAPAS